MRKFVFRLSLLTFLAWSGMPQTAAACPTGFCNTERQLCIQECAPCLAVSVCIIHLCDSTCSCQC
jgi:hypothetical protein